jgi:ERCC4-related helicase
LAPTIELAFQQFNVLESQISAVQVKFLTGNDNIDKWSEKAIWDAVLEGVGIMVSTHDVLYQAMSHGFVLLDCLSLLIFDEGKKIFPSRQTIAAGASLSLINPSDQNSTPLCQKTLK